MEETPAQVFSCGFCKSFKNAFLIKSPRVTPSVILTLLKFNFQFKVHFSPTEKRMCAYQGVRNVSFSENFAYVLNGWSLSMSLPNPTDFVSFESDCQVEHHFIIFL